MVSQPDGGSTVASSTPAATASTFPAIQTSDTSSASGSSSNVSISPGALAGIVLGAAIGLALITLLATCFFMRFYRRRRGQAQAPGGPGGSDNYVLDNEKASVERRNLDTFLPAPADDKTVRSKTTTLLDQIELHVENFYQNAAAKSSQTELELSNFTSPHLPGPLQSILPQSRQPISIIKHCLTYSTLSFISPKTQDPNTSLLPLEFVLLPSTVENSPPSAKSQRPAHDELLTRWRVLTAYILPPPSSSATYLARRNQVIDAFVQDFSHTFSAWQKPKYGDAERVQNLTEIIKGAAETGVWLFGQPCGFEWNWTIGEAEARRGNGREMLVVPGLVKVRDEQGRRLSRGLVVVEGVVTRI